MSPPVPVREKEGQARLEEKLLKEEKEEKEERSVEKSLRKEVKSEVRPRERKSTIRRQPPPTATAMLSLLQPT